jgi:ribulose-5-phosphate 4-epimerase/fuculose-1-phosphate aldolase
MHIDLVNEKVLGGKWTVTPAIELHKAAHAARDDVVWAVHNHPRWATVWAALHKLPGVHEQTGALIGPDVALYDEYLGGAATQLDSQSAVEALGNNAAVILANHGVFVVAKGVHQAYLRCQSLETRARLAWHIAAIGEGVPMHDAIVSMAGVMMDRAGWPGAWEAMVRRELRRDPSFLN